MQLDEESKQLYVVRYGSRLLGPAQRNYSTPEQECLGVVHFLGQWQEYFGDQIVHIFSDQRALESVIGNVFSANKRIMRWAIAISDVNFTIQHVEGKNNMSDMLSRLVGAGVEIEMFEE